MIRTDWEELAYDHGFKDDDKAMLTQWHHVDRLTINKIALKLEMSSMTVWKRMKLLEVEIMKVQGNLANYAPRLPGWRK